jgi:hypothetical protein
MAIDEAPRVIASFDSYEGMLEALRTRVSELQISGERFDEFAGLPKGYLSKLFGARPVRRLGMTSFSPVMAGLGLAFRHRAIAARRAHSPDVASRSNLQHALVRQRVPWSGNCVSPARLATRVDGLRRV